MSSYPGGPAFPGTGGPPFDPDNKGSTWSTFPGQNAYRPAQGPYSPAQGPQFPGASFPNASPMQFPQGPGGEGGFFGMPNPSSDYNPSYHNSSYSQPSSPPVHGGSPWMPGQSGPPPIPPRPSNYAPYAQPGPNYASTSSSGSSAFDFALSAVDKVAGRKARDQLETGVGSVFQSGNKLFNKLAK
ncbi:uncharacterized protein LACBIDRAFT_295735 [Laccaria bicolor S238N-H82]|uniref:Predicted protein n=1 Tax=Laccaria bicolor (strain S238N-H82 / ATCC MYA-4686) TaxID=486041 RepID=B0DXN2_LACBS|nr:uncharacterized protein LACBIDRAFT_295735 [Laccaria bicolor S238N-H82]EDR00712.1 predicted protein [Laccaria bicolor S238N-H82]|eukprot:XP_001888721.1 predicted protein [Laccaria bicolor S238N-H82]